MPKPYDFDNFGLGRVREYVTKLSSKNVLRTYGKAKMHWAFSFQVKTHGMFDMGVWRVQGS